MMSSARINCSIDGFADDPVVVLCMGAGEQLVHWPEPLITALVRAGLLVVRFDARDTGLSSWYQGDWPQDPRPLFGALFAGQPAALPYTLSDMAGDIVALLDRLGVAAAHLVGISLGAMQAQLVAAQYPQRVLSLTSIMSNSGSPEEPPPDPEISALLMSPPPAGADAAALIAHFIKVRKALGGTCYQRSEVEWQASARRSVMRAMNPAGAQRHIAASVACRDRHEQIKRIIAPTLIVHGSDDRVMSLAGVHEIEKRIPDAQLEIVAGMGHDLTDALAPVIAELAIQHIGRQSHH